MGMKKAMGHLVEHVAALGPINAWRVLRLKRAGKGREAVLKVPELAGPLIVRTGTSDLAIFDEVVIGSGYDFEIPVPPAIIVDAGANIGMASLWFAKKFPKARIIAVEPDQENFDLLVRNTKAFQQITPVHAAIAAHDGMIGLEREGLRPSSFHIRELSEGENGISAITIGTLMKQYGLDRMDLLKIDIEGAEKELFEAADLSWMERTRTIAIELHDRMKPGCGHAFFSAASRQERSYDVHEYLVIASLA